MLEATGERLVPDLQRGELVHAEHVARYLYAAPLARGRSVLDAACGEGYGSALLAAAGATRIVGVDVDGPTVEHAREHHGIDARRADVRDLPFADGEFDLVVSFETIEHVEQPERAVAELRRVLAPEGTLAISTPNPAEYLITTDYHVRELSPAEFESLLRREFDTVRFCYQRNWLTSTVLPRADFETGDETVALDVAFHKTVGGQPGDELYTIALCGPVAPEDLRSVAVAGGIDEAHRLWKLLDEGTARAREAERLVEEWRVRAQESERLVAEWNARATEAERLVEEWGARAEEAERLVAEWNARATEAERQRAEAREAHRRIEESLSWRITAPLRRLRGGRR